jgi:hypothetical protein
MRRVRAILPHCKSGAPIIDDFHCSECEWSYLITRPEPYAISYADAARACREFDNHRCEDFKRPNLNIECEHRRTRRFALTLPVRTTNPALGDVTGATRDVSSSGAYFYIESDSWKEAASIEFVLQLPSDITHGDPMTVCCVGKLVRVEHLVGKMVGIAVQIESFTSLQKQ